ncbi:MAG: hypothetical protein KAI47_07200, partial [Deltaproteobacteria bacterium]|nr:hypothetical protein [Deltaproteobacteria bacterium]
VKVREAPGVRGLSLLGAQAVVSLSALDRKAIVLTTRQCTAWGEGATLGGAFSHAFRQALACGASIVAETLVRRYAVYTPAAGQAAVIVRGVLSLPRYRAIATFLGRGGFHPRVRRIIGPSVTLSFPVSRRTNVVAALMAHAFGGFRLVREEGGNANVVVLRVQTDSVPLAPPSPRKAQAPGAPQR